MRTLPYHHHMANRKTGARKSRNAGIKLPGKANRVSISTVFWIFFIIVAIIIFFAMLPIAKKGISMPPKQTAAERQEPQVLEPPVKEPAVQEPAVKEPAVKKPAAQKPPAQKPPASEKSAQPEKPPAAKQTAKPPEKTPAAAVQETPKEAPQEKAPPEKPANQPPQPKAQQPARQPEQKQAETRDRGIYFMQEGKNGADLLLVKVNRKIAASNSPLIDSINALLAGPSAEESKRGLISCIPDNSRLISAEVVNNTAHLNFNEDFRYNTQGREDSAAQLKQIVWTATEFPNVNNVQIKINGIIVDFLVEGISIRNPIGRH